MPRPRGANYKESKHPRVPTDYVGVYYIEVTSRATRKASKVFYVSYYRGGERHYEKAVRIEGDKKIPAKTPAQANQIRAAKMEGRELPNVERREAEAAAKGAEAGKPTISRLFEEYVKQNETDENKLPNEKSRFRNYIGPAFGAKMPEEIDALSVDRLRVNLLKKRKPATVFAVLELLRRLVNFGVDKRLCAGLPFKVEMPAVDNLKTEDLESAELTRLMAVLREERLDDDPPDADVSINHDARDIMLTAIYTGLRRGSIFGLRWEDVDENRNLLKIRKPKSKKDFFIPLSTPVRELLKARTRTKSEYIFPGRDGGRRTDVKKALEKIRTRARLPAGFRPLHGQRHHYASSLVSDGVDLFVVSKLLGHADPSLTAKRYAHLRPGIMAEAAERAGRLVAAAEHKPAAKAEAVSE